MGDIVYKETRLEKKLPKCPVCGREIVVWNTDEPKGKVSFYKIECECGCSTHNHTSLTSITKEWKTMQALGYYQILDSFGDLVALINIHNINDTEWMVNISKSEKRINAIQKIVLVFRFDTMSPYYGRIKGGSAKKYLDELEKIFTVTKVLKQEVICKECGRRK